MQAQAAWLADGRMHLHHGPIDLILHADGPARARALRAAALRFDTLLDSLVRDLPTLRRPLDPHARFADPVARRMADAVRPFSEFVTPMAAVAGAVADDILATMRAAGPLTRLIVNNGGDVALYLAPGESVTGQVVGALPTQMHLSSRSGVGGVATSGWHGRSHSLGIADAVTVLASHAALADVAATLIANAVDLPDHPAIRRAPASELAPESDLGCRLVTTAVGPLCRSDARAACAAGREVAERFRARGLIQGAMIQVQGHMLSAGHLPLLEGADA